MERIINPNCCGICSERTCDNPSTEFQLVNVNGMEFLIEFCSEHAEMFEEKIDEQVRKKYEKNGIKLSKEL